MMAGKVQVDIKFVVIIISLLIMATMGSAYTTFMFFSRGETSAEAMSEVDEPGPKPFGYTYDAGNFTVNLSDVRGAATRFMRTGVVLAATEAKVISELETRAPQIRDAIISKLRGRSSAEVLSDEGMTVLKRDVIVALDAIVGEGGISDVYFTDLVVQ